MLYVKLVMEIPGAGTAIHAAELEPIDAANAKLHRLVELDPVGVVRGGAQGEKFVGLAAPPQSVVPHPDTYDDFPDITAEYLKPEEFEALWVEVKW